jgi:PTS system galactitol-specific IIB component
MKHMMICCGAGVATSTVALNKLQDFLKKENILDKVRISREPWLKPKPATM